MDSNLPENSAVQRCNTVQHGATVAAVAARCNSRITYGSVAPPPPSHRHPKASCSTGDTFVVTLGDDMTLNGAVWSGRYGSDVIGTRHSMVGMAAGARTHPPARGPPRNSACPIWPNSKGYRVAARRAGAGQPPRYPDDSRAGRRQKTFDCSSEGQDAKGRVL